MSRFINHNSGVKHIKFVDEAPISIQQMLIRSVNGLPLSVPRPKLERIPVNNRFYVDDFDVLDISIKNDMRISEEQKERIMRENKERKKQLDEFNAWKAKMEEELRKPSPEQRGATDVGTQTT